MLRVRDSMTQEVETLEPEAGVARAWHLCRERRIRHIPIVEDGKLVGLVSDRDLRDASPVRKSGDEEENVFGWSSMRDIMTSKPITIGPLETIEHAAREIYERKIGSLPVVGDSGELLGIITSSDMMLTLIKIFGSENPGTWLEIEVSNEPGSLAGIVDAVRERRVNIASLFVAPAHRASERTIVMRLETTNPKGVVERLEEVGYTVETVESAPFETTNEEK